MDVHDIRGILRGGHIRRRTTDFRQRNLRQATDCQLRWIFEIDLEFKST